MSSNRTLEARRISGLGVRKRPSFIARSSPLVEERVLDVGLAHREALRAVQRHAVGVGIVGGQRRGATEGSQFHPDGEGRVAPDPLGDPMRLGEEVVREVRSRLKWLMGQEPSLEALRAYVERLSSLGPVRLRVHLGLIKDLIIEVYNEAGQLALAYKVYRCWVSEYQALPDLDANANAVAIQHLKLEN